MRTIDADALAARLDNECREWEGESAYQAGLCAAAVIVAEAPTVKQKPTIGGWISVDDRLPEGRGEIYAEGLEDSAKVFVACITQDGKRKYGLARYIRDHELPGDDGWNGVTDENEEIDDRYTKVTHWMPLPELPEVEA